MKTVEIVCLIFRSVTYLKHIIDQMERYGHADGYKVTHRIVANDATEKVLNYLKDNNINHSVFNNPDPNEYYINRVYRAYNYAISSSEADIVCPINSDDAFSPRWLDNLLKHYDGTTIPASRLIESGKMPSGKHGMGFNCGRSVEEYDETKFLKFVEENSEDVARPGGLYMPCLLDPSFQYPNGNMHNSHGKFIKAGDAWAFENSGLKHITPYDSLVYHIQEGEKDE